MLGFLIITIVLCSTTPYVVRVAGDIQSVEDLGLKGAEDIVLMEISKT
ncbi:MAG: hypothetical protein ACUVQY_05495 [Thermoproteota archaeon]